MKAILERPQKEESESWETHINCWISSGLKQLDYCKQKGIDYFQFRKWRTRINKQKGIATGSLKFIQIKKERKEVENVLSLQMIFPNGVKVQIPSPLGKEQLEAVFQVIGGLKCSS